MTATGFVLVSSGQPVGTSNVLSYEVADKAGNTDVGFITINTVAPCFTEGTLIDTPEGPVVIETLRPGDLVLTLDHGPQVLRWIGRSLRRWNSRPITVSSWPRRRQNCCLARIRCWSRRRRCDGAPVVYVPLLFDRHEIVRGNGLWSESCHPGLMTRGSFDAETEAELRGLFPEIFALGTAGYGPSVRSGVQSHEAHVLVDAMR